MEITNKVNVTESQVNELEMHSLVNIISVINSQIQIIQYETGYEELFDPLIDELMALADACKAKNVDQFNIQTVTQFKRDLFAKLEQPDENLSSGKRESKTAIYKSIFKEIFRVFEARVEEFITRWENPGKWEAHDIRSFKKDFNNFFYAMEKNSKGRYRIIFNIAEQEEKDYLVQFAVNSDYENTIYIPIILKDVIRDLIANARKYTPPGGEINIGLSQKEGMFRFVVEDSGYGIPQDEIERIVEYGYRATNIKDKVKTMGGGFGLTKAYYVTKKFNGRFWIESEINQGTKISIEIPVPDHVISAF